MAVSLSAFFDVICVNTSGYRESSSSGETHMTSGGSSAKEVHMIHTLLTLGRKRVTPP